MDVLFITMYVVINFRDTNNNNDLASFPTCTVYSHVLV